jgi:rubrerythrin
VRSRAAATVLSRAGFREVYSMEGGIQAWDGFVAKGIPEAGMAYFPPTGKPEELMALAWMLEEGSRKFYAAMAQTLEDPAAQSLYRGLMADEEKHQESLLRVYRETAGPKADPGFPGSVISGEPAGTYMEGGMRVDEALDWTKEKEISDILELSLSLEVNSSDLYIKMERKVGDEKAKKTFQVLAEEEKEHLSRLSSAFERSLGRSIK